MCGAMEVSPTLRASRLARLRGLYAIVGEGDPIAQARLAVLGGAGVVQVRMKTAPAGEILRVSREVVAACRGRALVVVNDRADLAVLSGADGVHVGEEDLPVADARRIVGPDLLVGRSTRTLEEGRLALASGADHVGFGPMFATRSKSIAAEPRGLGSLRAVASSLGAPVVAIGGITLDTIEEVARAGAAAAAVIEDLLARGDVRERAARLAAAFAAGAGPDAGAPGGGHP
jgi:thiamine-phosphate pyrophosphorylase